jgi:hypothetical protein
MEGELVRDEGRTLLALRAVLIRRPAMNAGDSADPARVRSPVRNKN